MRFLTIGVLAVSVAAGACSRAETAPAGTALTSTPAPDATRNPKTAPIATAGRTEPGRPVVREITVPAGTRLRIVLDTAIGSNTSRVEQSVQAHLAQPIMVDGQTAVAEGTPVSGVVTEATRAGKVKGRARLAVRFDTLAPRGDSERYTIQTTAVGRTAPATKKNDAIKVGAPAAGGALIGGLIGGKKGALIGTAAGGGAGTAVVLSTPGKEVHMPKGSALTLRLTQPLTVRIRS